MGTCAGNEDGTEWERGIVPCRAILGLHEPNIITIMPS
jgi:hypothetical protein